MRDDANSELHGRAWVADLPDEVAEAVVNFSPGGVVVRSTSGALIAEWAVDEVVVTVVEGVYHFEAGGDSLRFAADAPADSPPPAVQVMHGTDARAETPVPMRTSSGLALILSVFGAGVFVVLLFGALASTASLWTFTLGSLTQPVGFDDRTSVSSNVQLSIEQCDEAGIRATFTNGNDVAVEVGIETIVFDQVGRTLALIPDVVFLPANQYGTIDGGIEGPPGFAACDVRVTYVR